MSKRFLTLGSFATALLLVGAGCISFGSTAAPAGPMGMFRSSDKGETWQQSNTLPTATGIKSLAGVKVYKIFVDPSDPNALYMATRGQGLFYSYDKGDSWKAVDVLSNRFIYGLAIDPTDKCTIYVTDGPNIFQTTDCSRTWKTVYTEQRGQSVVSLAIDYGNHSAIYAALAGGDILQSNNGGASWRVIKSFNVPLRNLVADPLTAHRLYVASADSGLARSDDGGVTWVSASQGVQNYNEGFYFYRLVLNPAKKDNIFWLCKYGILFSNDAGRTWSDLKLLSPPGSVNIYTFAVSPSNPKEMYYVGTILGENGSSRSTFYKSTDGGVNWVTKKLPTNTVPVTLNIHPKENNLLFMGFMVPEAN